MGIGFDVFKANIGWNLADSVMGSISNAIEKNSKENAARQKLEKEALDRNDMLRTLVFMVGNNIALDRGGKKAIAAVLSVVYDENISLFSIEEEIDAAYSELQSKSAKRFFSNIAAIHTDREHTCLMYVVMLLLYMNLSDENMALPVHAYNLALIKRYFAISRSELAECYAALAERLEKDTDDIADVFEELTSEESIKKIVSENPTLTYESADGSLPAPNACENPKEEIETTYNSMIQGSDTSFTDRFMLADRNPQKVIAAVNAYAKNCKGEEVFVLYDDSAFGNGKAGFLLSNKRLYICNSFEKPQEIALADILTVNFLPKAITVNNIKIDITMVNGQGAAIIADFLQTAIPFAMQAGKENVVDGALPDPKTYETPKEEFESLFYDFVQKANNDVFRQCISLAEDNQQKVIAAVKAYAKSCVGENILLVYDDSVFENGKVGFLLTNKKLYACNSFEKPQEIALSRVQSVTFTPMKKSTFTVQNGFISVNNVKLSLTAIQQGGEHIGELLRDFLTKAIPLAMQMEEQSE